MGKNPRPRLWDELLEAADGDEARVYACIKKAGQFTGRGHSIDTKAVIAFIKRQLYRIDDPPFAWSRKE